MNPSENNSQKDFLSAILSDENGFAKILNVVKTLIGLEHSCNS